MASTSVLDPFSTKPREQKVYPSQQIGGTMEYVEGLIDLIFKGPEGPFVNEGPVNDLKLEQLKQLPEHTITGFQNPRGIEDKYPGGKRIDEETLEQLKVWRMNIAKAPVQEKREEVDNLLKFHKGYEVPINAQGEFAGKYYEVQTELAEAELISKQQREADRAEALRMATGNRTSSKAAVSGVAATELAMSGEEKEGAANISPLKAG